MENVFRVVEIANGLGQSKFQVEQKMSPGPHSLWKEASIEYDTLDEAKREFERLKAKNTLVKKVVLY